MEAGFDPGYPQQQQPYARDYMPTDMIELNKDFFQPSATYSGFFSAVQKDIVLGNLQHDDIRQIELRFGNIEDCKQLIAKNPNRWGHLNTLANYYLAWIALRVSEGRGRDSITARLMRTTFTDQRASMQHLTSMERKQEGMVNKARRFVGI